MLVQWVQCGKCEFWQHQICALYNEKRDLEGKGKYVCPKCCLEEIGSGQWVPLPKMAAFEAKDLPRTILSDHIERRLFTHLDQEREERAMALGKKIDEVIFRCKYKVFSFIFYFSFSSFFQESTSFS